MITLQYLENAQDAARLTADAAVEKLRLAHERIPFTHLLIGWHVPPPTLEALRAQAEHLRVRFLRWQPLLAGAAFAQSEECRVVGLSGRRVRGFQNQPDFTFVCPNHPRVQEAVVAQVDALAAGGLYQGFFLDRIRYPSPAADPLNDLGCFCEHCRRKAAGLGLDLEAAQDALLRQASDAEGGMRLALALLGGALSLQDGTNDGLMRAYLNFRSRSVADLVGALATRLQARALEVGLDCYSPALCPMVGQDLAALSACADWIKIMCYAHTLGPAGLPFELLGMCRFLHSVTGMEREQILKRMAAAMGLELPGSPEALGAEGISPEALRQEVTAGVQACRVPVLAGIELVELPGITRLNDVQLQADLQAVRAACPAGLSLSWDLLHMPMHRLDLAREIYLEQRACTRD